jgi:predicted regulator of Ras-like GTPase activity (Roadblock/LC7/MglB family)
MSVPAMPRLGELGRLLHELNAQGGFLVSVLTDQAGLPIASAGAAGQVAEAQAAVVALVEKTAGHVRQQLGMAKTDEVSLFETGGRRLVCRPFEAGNHGYVLAVMVPDRRSPYRLLTNRTVKTLRQMLSSLWE